MRRISDTIIEVLDVYTGRYVSYNKTTTNEAGGPMTDGDCDAIYRKLGTEYFKRNINERIYPREFGAVGNGTTDDSTILNYILSKYTRYIIDGEGLTYRAFDIVLKAGNKLQNIKLNCNDSTKTVIRFGNIESGLTVYNSGLTLKNITISGTFNYGLIISNCTDYAVDQITFFGATATTTFLYLNRMYEGMVNNIQFPGCSGALTTKCIYCDVGVNGVTLAQVYTSGFIGYGIFIASGASITIQNCVLQGHAYGLWLTGCTGITIINPYFEQTVNPIVVDNTVISGLTGGEVNGVKVINGIFLTYLAGHTFTAQDNLVFVKHKGSNAAVIMEGCRYANVGTKKVASVDGSAVMSIINPHLQGSAFLDLRQQCYKESTAVSTAGYYMEFHGGVNGNNTAYVTVRRTAAGANGHITEYTDSGNNKIYSTSWAPPTIGNAQPTDTWYTNQINETPKTSSYTLTTTDEVILFNTTSANLTATLPAAPPKGKIFFIKKTAAANTISVVVSGGTITMDGLTTYSIAGLNDMVSFEFAGTNYIVRTGAELAQKGVANGIATLDGSTLVPTAQLATGTANSTTFYRGDRTFAAALTGPFDAQGRITATITTEQIRAAYDASNYFSTTVASTGATTLAVTGSVSTITINNNCILGGNLQSSTSSSASNVFIAAGAGAAQGINTAGWVFGGAATVDARFGMNGTTSTVVGAARGFANMIIGSNAFTTAASGTHPMGAGLVVKAPLVTIGTATVTDLPTLCIDNVSTAGVNNWAILVRAGASKFSGALHVPIITVTANTTLDATHHTVIVNNSGAVTITLPTATSSNGRMYHIKKISGVSNNVVVQGNGAELIDGANTLTMATQYSVIQIQSNGTSWFVVAAYIGGSVL